MEQNPWQLEDHKKHCTICSETLIDCTTHDDPGRRYICKNGHHHNDIVAALADLNEYPLVSVITPTRNRRKYIPRLVDSYLAQDWPNTELLVIDGGSGSEICADLLPTEC